MELIEQLWESPVAPSSKQFHEPPKWGKAKAGQRVKELSNFGF
jgi:hypothetical protein